MLAYLLACLALLVSGFCRAVRTNANTLPSVRLAMQALTMAALAGIGAVLIYGHEPSATEALMACATAGVQVVTGVLWRHGVPACFTKDCNADRQ